MINNKGCDKYKKWLQCEEPVDKIIDPQIIKKIEAVVYAMGDKFSDDKDMDELREEIKMTRLGRMLVKINADSEWVFGQII